MISPHARRSLKAYFSRIGSTVAFRTASSTRFFQSPTAALAFPLLLLIHLVTTHPVTLRVCSAHGDGAVLAVTRHDNPTACNHFAAFHDVEPQYMVVDFSVRP